MSRFLFLLILVVGLFFAEASHAISYLDWENWMSSATAVRRPPHGEHVFRNNIGFGFAYAPVYAGGENYEYKPLPLLDTEYAGRVFASTQQGIGFNIFRGHASRFAPRLTWYFGRDSADDPALTGMPDVDPSLEIGLFGEGYTKSWRFRGDIRTDILDGHNGTTAFGDAAYAGRWSREVSLIFGGRLTYMDSSYAESYFGVPSQSETANRPAFTAESGFRDISGYAQFIYDLPKGAYFSGEARLVWLLGSAADSPLSQNETFGVASLMVGYRF